MNNVASNESTLNGLKKSNIKRDQININTIKGSSKGRAYPSAKAVGYPKSKKTI